MASQDESTDRGVRRRADRLGQRGRYCALCFLTLGSREERVDWGEGFAHPSCVARLRKQEAA